MSVQIVVVPVCEKIFPLTRDMAIIVVVAE